MIRIGSQVALVPVWFLAVYILVVALVPLTHAAWRRWGFASVVAPVIAAVLVDLGTFAAGIGWIGWLNYVFVWLTVHQLGYAWHDGRLAGVKVGALALCRRDSQPARSHPPRPLSSEPGRGAER